MFCVQVCSSNHELWTQKISPVSCFSLFGKDPVINYFQCSWEKKKAPVQDEPSALSVSDASLGLGLSSNVTNSDLFTLFGKPGRK